MLSVDFRKSMLYFCDSSELSMIDIRTPNMSTVSGYDARGDDSSASAAGYPLSAPFVDSTPMVTPRLRKWYKGYPGTSTYKEYKAWGVKGFFLGFWSPSPSNGGYKLTWGGLDCTAKITDMYESRNDYECAPRPYKDRTQYPVTVTDTEYLKWLTKDIQDAGGTIVPSVGGSAGTLMEQKSGVTVDQAVNEYLRGINNYSTKFLDFDIESPLTDEKQREAHIEVLLKIREKRKDVKLSHTLPTGIDGYNNWTLDLLNAMANHKPKYVPDMIIGMLMELEPSSQDYWDSMKTAATKSVAQNQKVFGSSIMSWDRFGLCPMFGANLGASKDPKKVTTICDMKRLVDFAKTKGVATVTGWSANRDYNQNNPDQKCEQTPVCPVCPEKKPYKCGTIDYCTLVTQQEAEFSRIAGTYTGKSSC